jgi:hypothetical protein
MQSFRACIRKIAIAAISLLAIRSAETLSVSTRWKLTIASLSLPFLVVSLFSWAYYAHLSSLGGPPLWTSLGVPVACLSIAIPIKLAPIKDDRYRVVFGVLVFVGVFILLLYWNLICAVCHGDSL